MAVRLVGGNRGATASGEWSNRDGIGATILAEVDGKPILRHLQAGEGFSAQNSNTLLLPVGRDGEITRLDVRWPSGKSCSASALKAGKLVTIYEDPGEAPEPVEGATTGLVLSDY
mgnify:CR=1 FL=1